MDLKLIPGFDGAEIEILPNQDANLTGGLSNSAYLSLFTSPYWGNGVSENPLYDSQIPKSLDQNLTNRARLSIQTSAKKSLAWMLIEGIAREVEAIAEIQSPIRLNLGVTIRKAQGIENLALGINWDQQEQEL
jgi:phage gp46-like protein